MKKIIPMILTISLALTIWSTAQAFTITITPDPDPDVTLNTFCAANHYQDTVTDDKGNQTPNPEDKPSFCKRLLSQYVVNVNTGYDLDNAVQIARTNQIAASKQAYQVK